MNEYVINSDLLCFMQQENNKDLFIIEKNKNISIKMNSLKFLKKCCYCFGHSYMIQRQFIIDNFNYNIKTPIIVSEYNNIILFPTASPSSKKCIWIAYNNIERYVQENDYTKIYFNSGKVLKFKVPYYTIDKQITRCIKIEKFLTNLQLKKI